MTSSSDKKIEEEEDDIQAEVDFIVARAKKETAKDCIDSLESLLAVADELGTYKKSDIEHIIKGLRKEYLSKGE